MHTYEIKFYKGSETVTRNYSLPNIYTESALAPRLEFIDELKLFDRITAKITSENTTNWYFDSIENEIEEKEE